MRASAVYSTALKSTSDMLRRGLRVEQFTHDDQDDLPDLRLFELTNEDVAAMHESHRGEELDGLDELAAPEVAE